MKKRHAIFPILATLCLILDSRTASYAAAEGVELVLRTALPALFPFFVLSAMLVPYSSLVSIPPLSKLLGVPEGWESVFLLGLVGGYPVGAQCVAQGYGSGQLKKQDAERMLGFCTNCGPSFLFGIVGAAFSELSFPFAIFLIGLASALLTAAIWPEPSCNGAAKPTVCPVRLPQAVQTGLRSMASVGAWIILGKILLAFLDKWFLRLLPEPLRLTFTGLLELTNGCLLLDCFSDSIRFIAACCITTFGGLCVWMQVKSLCAKVGLQVHTYLPQKMTQSAIAAVLSLIYLGVPGGISAKLAAILLCTTLVVLFRKKTVEISKTMVYNRGT